MTDPIGGPSILWLTPDKPHNISIGRQRIADHLETEGFEVTLRGTNHSTFSHSMRERGQFDGVVGTTRLGAFAGSVISRLHRIPLVVDHVDPIRQFRETHPRWLSAVVERLENQVFGSAAHVLYVYPEERNRIEQRTTHNTKTDLGVEFEAFASADGPPPQRTEIGPTETNNYLAIYVGGLEPIYSIPALLESMEHLEDWTLVVIGAGSLEGMVEDAAARDDIVFLGTVAHEDVPAWMSKADVGISLVDDPHTLKVLEYGAAGLPVVQLAGRARERYGEMVTYCERKPREIARAIERAHSSGPSEELKRYAADFDWQEIAEVYCDVLVEVLAND